MPKPPSNRRKTKYLALSSVLCALGVIFLYIGSIFELLDLTMVAAASLIVALAVMELGGRYPMMIWGVTSALSLLLLPSKFAALCYFGLCGYYPMLKPYLERLPRMISWILKVAFFQLVLAAVYFLALFVFHLPNEQIGYALTYFGMGNVAMILYDLALTRLSYFYFIQLRKKLGIDRFLRR